MIGTTVDGKYQIVKLLGQGGMGAVYEATHLGTGRRVALKLIIGGDLSITGDSVARFQREARAAGAIESQHIVQVLDSGMDRAQGLPFMVMEYLIGEDLDQVLERLGALAPDLALRIVAQACAGLQKAHEANVVHRDIKPANLYLSRRDGGELLVQLLDFGIAKVKMDQLTGADRGLTRTGSMLGSPLYMSPEQAMGLKTIDHRTDVWSIGAVLYQALSGRTPHHDKDTFGQLIMAICSAPPQPIQGYAPWVPPEVAEIVHRALRLDPNERFATAQAMLDAIRAVLPNSWQLHQSMVISLSDTARRNAAPTFRVPTDGGARTISEAAGGAPVLITQSGTVSPSMTANPLTATHGAQTPRSKAPLVAGLLLAAAALTGGAVFVLRGKAPVEVAPAPPPTSIPSTLSAAPAPSEPLVVPALSAALPTARAVNIVVIPANAAVELDGSEVALNAGVLRLEGALGSSHLVVVSDGKKKSTTQVVIAESGAVPDHVELTAANAAALGPAAAGGVAARAHPGAAVAAAGAAPAPAAPKPSKPQRPAGQGQALDKNFE